MGRSEAGEEQWSTALWIFGAIAVFRRTSELAGTVKCAQRAVGEAAQAGVGDSSAVRGGLRCAIARGGMTLPEALRRYQLASTVPLRRSNTRRRTISGSTTS
jgi:hypothetical protein